ncbi:hypothetical protein VTK73DRAFT_3272 [Phialemonium thermophilum]|uniref:E3 ubiquitin-protein ligase n=1 Tax=Phialemonium thermophilum TaxID=223376 RepID=A0ABR3Y7K1_9PEZI
MDPPLSSQEIQLCRFFKDLPARYRFRYSKDAARELLASLFWSMAGGSSDYMRLFFPLGDPLQTDSVKLSDAQGTVEGAEYTEAARGRVCGHIFKAGEPMYTCRTCSADDTCCLCSKCYDATDHNGHMVRISVSPGNSGCCDCGDPEAWKTPMFCTIHSMWENEQSKGKGKEAAGLPEDLVANMRMTISRALDYMCDVISCSPEQLRQSKTVETIQYDEEMSRLCSPHYGEDIDPPGDFVVLLWNDEKHTVLDVQEQLARACGMTAAAGLERAYETDAVGRTILMYEESIERLLEVASIIEQIRLTVTIRSSRDIFREQMCATLVEWLSDISGCSVGSDHNILRRLVCEELLRPWRKGSPATHAIVGKDGIDDEDEISTSDNYPSDLLHALPAGFLVQQTRLLGQARAAARREAEAQMSSDEEEDDDDDFMAGAEEGEDDEARSNTPLSGEMDEDEEEEEARDEEDEDEDEDVMVVEPRPGATGNASVQRWRQAQAMEGLGTTLSNYPQPPPTVTQSTRRNTRERDLTPSDSDNAEPLIAPTVYAKAGLEVPKTPGVSKGDNASPPNPGRYWLGAPSAYVEQDNLPLAENLFERVRLDWLILFDLRLWKRVRNDLRFLYISTVVTIPEFKRILGLRFAGLYTTLAQLYLIGDREPDHSIINLSVQMLTTPSITAEIVERGNFLTNLMAILYTFLTTRQVGHPWDVSSNAVLAFDAGSVTNRRMYHFFLDLKYLFSSPHVQERLRTEERYMMQFLDLVKLHQGICPNVRAVGEHVEYETDSWISASLITREINRLCRQFAESFRNLKEQDLLYLYRAIRLVAKTVIINSIGAERARFSQAEIKDEVKFKLLSDFEFDDPQRQFSVVKFVVEEQPISFHHALHYTLSWLIECGKAMPVEQLRALLTFTTQELFMKPRSMGKKQMPRRDYSPEDYLMAAIDFPLRVCAWLAQMKAGMWVRNGLSLRHQAGTYRGVGQRDVSYHRDIFLLQTALAVCDPSRVLVSIVDRFGMEKWVKGFFKQKSKAQDDAQHLDVVEDMLHLLIVLLSDRTCLLPSEEDPTSHLLLMRRDLIHVLCFKPLSFSEICNKLPDRFQEQEEFHRLLNEMTTFKFPEGVSDVGTFELKAEYVEEIDPYIAHYNKNQREEAETAYRKLMAKRTGKSFEDIVYEPKRPPITSGAFTGLPQFTKTGIFAQIVYYSLLYTLVSHRLTPAVPSTRVETFLQVVLHLILLAISEDHADETDPTQPSFVAIALERTARSNFMPDAPQAKTIVALLNMISSKEEFKSCHPKVALVLRRMRQRRPHAFDYAYHLLGLPIDRISTASPASTTADEERERRKKLALERQARVMAQFQQQQKSFLANQGDIDWGDVDDMDEDMELPPAEEHKNSWKYPTGTCILCQEDTDDRRLYGTFAFLAQSHILRQTDLQDSDFVREVFHTPENLDRSAEHIRPFGVAHENRTQVQKVNAKGETFMAERQVVGKGFPARLSRPGPVSIGCGHIMHYSCFEMYFEATIRRHSSQIARHPPEDTSRQEFVCPLCKALGNAFLPIIWKGKEESYPGVLQSPVPFGSFLDQQLQSAYYILGANRPPDQVQNSFAEITSQGFVANLAERSSELIEDAWAGTERMDSTGSTPFGDTFTITSPERSARSRRAAETSGMIEELVAAYRRLRDTLQKNELESRHLPGPPDAERNELFSSDTLARAVGYSISAVEIQQRGVEAEYGLTFLDKIPEQVLTHLRILGETVTSYIAVGGLREAGENRIDTEYRKDSERQHCQLFIAQYLDEETEHTRRPADAYPPLLSQDLFIFLCECVFGVIPAQGFEIAHMVRLCYLAEITKVVYHLGRNIPAQIWVDRIVNAPESQDSALRNFRDFCRAMVDMEGISFSASRHSSGSRFGYTRETPLELQQDNRGFDQPGFDTLESWYNFTRKYALTFLRKCEVLLNVKYGVDFNSHVSPSPELKELERLTEALRVPSFDEMLTALTDLGPQHDWPSPTTSRLVQGWFEHQSHWLRPLAADPDVSLTDPPPELPSSAFLGHPGIFELVGLPQNYDALIELCASKKCPTMGKDISDPILCLFCGEILCGQGICCVKEERIGRSRRTTKIGGANQHMRKCQKNIGLYINVRRCCVIYLHRTSGSFGNAPYIDRYGEVDMGLRHGRQLYLHQRRYDSTLRALWLSHGIPSFIGRKLEADFSNGGWETL